MQETKALTIGIDHPRCPYCHAGLQPQDAKAACTRCMAWHHQACVTAHGRCAACGDPLGVPLPATPGRRKRRRVPAPKRSVSLLEAVRPTHAHVLIRQLGIPTTLAGALLLGLLGAGPHSRFDVAAIYTHRYQVVLVFVVMALLCAWIFQERTRSAGPNPSRRAQVPEGKQKAGQQKAGQQKAGQQKAGQ